MKKEKLPSAYQILKINPYKINLDIIQNIEYVLSIFARFLISTISDKNYIKIHRIILYTTIILYTFNRDINSLRVKKYLSECGDYILKFSQYMKIFTIVRLLSQKYNVNVNDEILETIHVHKEYIKFLKNMEMDRKIRIKCSKPMYKKIKS